MSALDVTVILLAGLAAGTVNPVVGNGTLITFPTLLALGVPPVVANASNTVGLVPGGLSGSWGYRRELAGQRVRVWILALASALGAVGGAVLLLVLPAATFDAVVPVLVLAAVALVAVQPWLSRWLRSRPREPAPRRRVRALPPRLTGIAGALGVYGGYFGAAQGVLLVACLALGLDEELQVVNAMKNVAVTAANAAGTVVFVVAADLDWAVVALIAVSSALGGLLGARYGRRLPAPVLRALVVAIGLVVGVRLLVS